MNQLHLAARHFRIAQLCFRVALGLCVLAVAMLSGLAFAQEIGSPVAAPPASQPIWLALLLGVLPMLIAALVAIKPMLKLADWLHARALDQGRSAVAKLALLAGESLAKSVEHFLEATGGDYADLADPSQRAAALKHIEDQAKAGALPAVADALQALGASWLAGAASTAVDAAAAKASAMVKPADAPSPS